MKLVLISDTHSLHEYLTIPPCDLLIHAGDFCGRKSPELVFQFLEWFERQPARHRVLIAGNHDIICEEDPLDFARMLRGRAIHYLNDSGVTLEDQVIWGSPVQPRFFDWAFNRDRGAQIKKHWDLIPSNTAILITHGPPLGIGDRNSLGEPVGCADLLETVLRIEPRLHVFGHIHEGHGMYRTSGRLTRFVNAAMFSADHRRMHVPVEIDL